MSAGWPVIAAACVSGLATSGCGQITMHPAHMAQGTGNLQGMWQAFEDQLAQNAHLVRQEHFDKCTKDLEKPGGHGVFSNAYKVAGPYTPDVTATCNLTEIHFPMWNHKSGDLALGYVVTMQRTAGALVNSGTSTGVCAVQIRGGKVASSEGNAMPTIRRDSSCLHHLPRGRPQQKA